MTALCSRLLLALLIILTSTSGVLLADEPVAASDPFQLPELPPMDFTRDVNWYPPRAMAAGLEGRVLVAFDITSAGSAQRISVLWTEDALLASSAEQMLSKAHFKVPTDWQTSGAWRRWRLGFIYCLPPSSQSEEFGVPVETVLITGSRLHGAPQRHPPPDPNSASRCVKQPRPS
jgi:TonB family protein